MANLEFLKNKKIGVFGFGREGQSLVEFLSRNGIDDIAVFDEKDGELSRANLQSIDLAFRSPGFKLLKLKQYLADTCQISSGTDLFLRLKKGTVIGVTGTKGKSTTSSLIADMLKNCEKKVFIGGNIGISPLTFVDELDENSYTIIEMSSFQLQGLDLKPDVAVVLPIGVDHLDYHEDETEYRQAKANIARSDQDGILVLPYDGETKESFLSIPESNKYYYEKAGFEDGVACGIRDGLGYCKRNDREYFYDDLEATVSKLKIPKENLLAALTCLFALDIGVDLEKLTQNFERLPLRIEFVGEKSGKKYYNDSAATNPVSTIEACNLMDEDFVLIAGGSSKGLDYSQMASKLAKCEKLKAVLLIGDTGKEIDLQLDRAGYAGAKKYLYALSDCLKYLDSLEIPYGAVLFSPASASFDQYKDYKHRGEEFNRLINV